MITYTTEYNTAQVENNTIKSIYCIVRGEDENGNFETVGKMIVFDQPIPYSDFNSITKEQVDTWVKATSQYAELEQKVADGIGARASIAIRELPWANEFTPPPVANTVPDSVTPLQIRMAINAAGLRDLVESYVATLTQSEKDAWEYATIIERDNPILVNGAIAIGKTEQELDDLFVLASTFV